MYEIMAAVQVTGYILPNSEMQIAAPSYSYTAGQQQQGAQIGPQLRNAASLPVLQRMNTSAAYQQQQVEGAREPASALKDADGTAAGQVAANSMVRSAYQTLLMRQQQQQASRQQRPRRPPGGPAQ